MPCSKKNTIAGGTSGRTTGKVTSQHGITYLDLMERLGEKTARAYAEANQAAVEKVEQIIKAEKIQCDWQRDESYVFTTEPEQAPQFRREAEAAARLGLPASLETDTPLPFPVVAAVKFEGQGKFNSQKYLLRLANAIDGEGSWIFEHSGATTIRDGTSCLVRTRQGVITSKQIIVAANVPTFPLVARVGYCVLEYPTESFIIAARAQQELSGMYISPDANHNSILPITVNGEPHIIFAGEGGNLPGFRIDKKSRHERLAEYARENFGASEVTNRWSDRDYLAYDDLPLIGKIYPWSKNLYTATAYRKWGLTNGTAAGMILCDLITGQPNPWAEHFTPQHTTPITSIPRAISRHLGN